MEKTEASTDPWIRGFIFQPWTGAQAKEQVNLIPLRCRNQCSRPLLFSCERGYRQTL